MIGPVSMSRSITWKAITRNLFVIIDRPMSCPKAFVIRQIAVVEIDCNCKCVKQIRRPKSEGILLIKRAVGMYSSRKLRTNTGSLMSYRAGLISSATIPKCNRCQRFETRMLKVLCVIRIEQYLAAVRSERTRAVCKPACLLRRSANPDPFDVAAFSGGLHK